MARRKKRRKLNRRRHRKYAVKNRRRFLIAIGIMVLLVLLMTVFMVRMIVNSATNIEKPAEKAKVSTEATTEVQYPKAEGNLILVNKHNSLEDGYKPDDLAIPQNVISGAAHPYMRKVAADAFDRLAADASREGHTIRVVSAYRDDDYQRQIYNQYVARRGQAEADTFSARPLYSEHQTGLAADVSSPSMGYELKASYINTAEGKWLEENCYKYGFIIRFPEGKEEVTGYTYEPWHIRYVGKDNAKNIFEKGITLEEYLGQENADKYLD